MNRVTPSTARSYLFVPGNRPERFAKALGSGADAVVIDLEDAVAPEHKDAARAALAGWAGAQTAPGPQLVVRINGQATDWFSADLELLRTVARTLGPIDVMLPKTESAQQVAQLTARLPAQLAIIALVETARGVAQVDAIARAPRVRRIAFGTIDYALDLGLSGDPSGLLYPASRIAIASRAAGLPSPIAGVTAAVDDEAALRADFNMARACGFGAKLCIHPRQVAPVHAMLAPSPEQLAWAARVVEAAQGGEGACTVEGKMVDRPVLSLAQAILRYPAATTGLNPPLNPQLNSPQH